MFFALGAPVDVGVGEGDAGGFDVEAGPIRLAVGDALAFVVAIDDGIPRGLVVARLQDGGSAVGAGLGDGLGHSAM